MLAALAHFFINKKIKYQGLNSVLTLRFIDKTCGLFKS
jgi:hypothetical protein